MHVPTGNVYYGEIPAYLPASEMVMMHGTRDQAEELSRLVKTAHKADAAKKARRLQQKASRAANR